MGALPLEIGPRVGTGVVPPLDRAAKISRRLHHDRELALCGDADVIPREPSSAADAWRARKVGARVLALAEEVVGSLRRPPGR